MSKPFTRTFRVRYSETNATGQVSLATYLRYLMETAWDWGATGGLSMAENKALGLAWIIGENQLNIYRPLAAEESFDFTIWLLKWRRIRGTRCFELRLKDGGERIADGVQQVATLDSQTLRPVRPPQELMQNFLSENPRVIQQRDFPRFQLAQELAFKTQRAVDWRDIDTFQHVNNATYPAYVENAALQALGNIGWSPATFNAQGLTVINHGFHIRYQVPALWGETLDIFTYLVQLDARGGTWYMEVQRQADGAAIVQCTLDWSLVDRESGVAALVPENLRSALEIYQLPGTSKVPGS